MIERGRSMRAGLLLALAVFCAGCPHEGDAQPPRSVPVEPVTPPPEARKDGRLPSLATPLRYKLDLRIDPAKTGFRGSANIDVVIAEPTAHVVLHARDLALDDVRAVVGKDSIPGRAQMRMAEGGKANEELVLTFARPLPPGPATLVLGWNASFSPTLTGLYHVDDGDRWYAFTQSEPTDARRIFPCFDEPSFKTPFEVAITAPKGALAFANAPETSRSEGADGTTFVFAPTKPLPTYLVAFAVGEFDVRESDRTTAPKIRLIATKGKTGLGELALQTTSQLVDTLEGMFGVPYPFEKLDIVAVPDFGAGAMENPGLITFRDERLLVDPLRGSAAARRAQAIVIAHELAHQWFGNLVTATWWNDLWLNEGMATWAEYEAVQRWRPQMGLAIDAVVDANAVMDTDGLMAARAVRQPVVSTTQADEAFDGITYEKGAAIMRTVASWIGDKPFREGIRSYLTDFAWKSVQADALLGALDRASGKNVTQMASGFLDKTGVPVVSMTLACEQGARWNAEITQEPWRPLGTRMPEEHERTWTIPVCVRAQGDKKSTCALLAMGAPSLVAGQGRCPQYIHPNYEGGYYRFALEPKELVRLAKARTELDVPARVSLLSNTWAAVRAGKLKPEVLLEILPAFDDETSRQAATQVVAILVAMDTILVEDVSRAPFRKFALARLEKRKKALGFLPKRGEGEDEALLRRDVLAAMGDVVEDETTLKEAEEHAAKWLADPTKIDSDTAAVALDLASRRAGQGRFDDLVRVMKTAKTREDRISALKASLGFGDPRILAAALEFSLTDEVKPSEMRYVIASAFSHRKTHDFADEWVEKSWDKIRKKLQGPLALSLTRAVSTRCTKAGVADAEAILRPRFEQMEGARRRYDEALEGATLCSELRARGASNLTRALLNAKP